MQTALPVQTATSPDVQAFTQTRGGRILLVLCANALLAISAHISIPLFFTPVPLTLQTFAVILTGLMLGPIAGLSAVLLYLAEGAAGLPVFNPAGLGGVAQLLGPTGGYLMAYPLAAAAAGLLVRAPGVRRMRFGAALAGGAAACVITLACGAAWLAHLSPLSWHSVTALAIAPFIPSEIIKVIAAAAAYTGLRRFVRS